MLKILELSQAFWDLSDYYQTYFNKKRCRETIAGSAWVSGVIPRKNKNVIAGTYQVPAIKLIKSDIFYFLKRYPTLIPK